MEKAGRILGSVLKKHDISKVSTLGRFTGSWDGLVGSSISAHTSPIDLRDGILFILVDSPVWMQQLSFLKAEMLEKLSKHGVSDIMLRLGRVDRTRQSTGSNKVSARQKNRVLASQDLQLIDNCVRNMENQNLRHHIERLIRNALEHPK